MALISSKGIYGLGAIYELSKHKKGVQVRASDISSATNIPLGYLEQLLGKLKKAGFVESIRGAGGGYRLAVDAQDIKICDVIIALEGQIKVVDECNNDILKIFFNDIKSKLSDNFSLSLAEMHKYQDKYNATLHYDI